MQKGNEQQPCTTFYRNGYGEKDTRKFQLITKLKKYKNKSDTWL